MTDQRQLGPLTTRLADLMRDLPGADDEAHPYTRLARELGAPLRLAVTGRIKAGKSTLVNALLGQRVAPTDVGECTRVVTWYRYGVPEGLEVVLRNGSVETMSLERDGSVPSEIGQEASEVERIEVSLSVDALRRWVIVDTPGLASAQELARPSTGALLGIDADSRAATRQADALLMVSSGMLGIDERSIVDGFRSRFGGLTPSPLNVVGVLTRIDEVADPRNPVATVGDRLELLIADLADLTPVIHPVVGLWAEAATCGLVDEDVARAVAALGSLPDFRPELDLLSVERVLRRGEELAGVRLDLALARVGLTGLRHLVTEQEANPSATRIERQLRESSGIDPLVSAIEDRIGRHADALRTSWAIGWLERWGTEHGAERTEIANLVDEVIAEPAFARVGLVRVFEGSKEELAASQRNEVIKLLTSPWDPDTWHLDEVVEALEAWRSWSEHPLRSGSERLLAERVLDAYQALGRVVG